MVEHQALRLGPFGGRAAPLPLSSEVGAQARGMGVRGGLLRSHGRLERPLESQTQSPFFYCDLTRTAPRAAIRSPLGKRHLRAQVFLDGLFKRTAILDFALERCERGGELVGELGRGAGQMPVSKCRSALFRVRILELFRETQTALSNGLLASAACCPRAGRGLDPVRHSSLRRTSCDNSPQTPHGTGASLGTVSRRRSIAAGLGMLLAGCRDPAGNDPNLPDLEPDGVAQDLESVAMCPPAAPTACGVAPSYAKDIAPLLQRACVPCHAPGGPAADRDFTGAFDQVSYASFIRLETTDFVQVDDCLMPPPDAGPDATLSLQDRTELLRWFVCGSPEN